MNTKRRFRGADLFVPVLLVGLAAFAGFLAFGREAAPTVRVRYTLCVSDCTLLPGERSAWESVDAGDAVRSENGTAMLGRVVSLRVRPHKAAVVRDGSFAVVTVPARFDVYVTVEGDGTRPAGRGLRISDIRIAAGSIGNFQIGGRYAEGATVVFAEGREVTE